MRLYQFVRDNGAEEPWLVEIERGVYVDLDWKQWLIGAAVYGDSCGRVLSVSFGPLMFSFYLNQ
jgi:hypothetical protein